MIVIIGGSGFYGFLSDTTTTKVDTPFGQVICEQGEVDNNEIAFIPRHGKKHSIPPSQINYRANIYAAHMLDTEMILTTNAVGAIRKEFSPGSLILPDQILDFTSGRQETFFDGSDFSIKTRKGRELSGVIHTDMTHPYDPRARSVILEAAQLLNLSLHDGGTMVVVNGPRYETPAEIAAYRVLGGDLAGMTSAPEAFLAREIDIPYATVAVATNYAAGMQSSISHEEVGEIFSEKMDTIKSLFTKIIATYN